jgi:2-polyprenyl-3-methyl-5-hydroxy-6-metoxy-1,4-benzoquinol methylase
MSEYYWDSKIEYLKNTRWLYYNDDYLEFLVKVVWKIEKPVNIIDFGCGYGYLGLKLLPLLPDGSSYTGIDKGPALIDEAKSIYKDSPYTTEFIVADITDMAIERKYDIAICHALLLHVTDIKLVIQKMIDSVTYNGIVICFEPHHIAGMSCCHLEGVQQSQISIWMNLILK